MNRALVLAPHTDDGEIGCGGTIAKLIEDGTRVYYATFSVCEDSVPAGFPKDILEKEVKAATQTLGIAAADLRIYKYPVRRFNEFRQNILEDLIHLRDDVQPDIVFMPCESDAHQDHHVIAEEGFRAFKRSSIFCYEIVWNSVSMQATGFVTLQQHHVDKKIEAILQYSSQRTIRSYMNRSFFESLAIVRGAQIGSKYAEAFEVKRWIQ